jgi:hypothetical protein
MRMRDAAVRSGLFVFQVWNKSLSIGTLLDMLGSPLKAPASHHARQAAPRRRRWGTAQRGGAFFIQGKVPAGADRLNVQGFSNEGGLYIPHP